MCPSSVLIIFMWLGWHTKHLGLFLDENYHLPNTSKRRSLKQLRVSPFLSSYLNTFLRMFLICRINFMCALIWIMVTSFIITKEWMNLVAQVQYKYALVVSGCWQRTSQVNIYNELGWESLSDRRWHRRLCLFYKICKHDTPQYLHNHLPPSREVTYRTRSSREFYPPVTRTSRFTNSFYPYCISEWEKLNDEVRSLPTLDQFKSNLILYIRPSGRPMYGIHDIEGVKVLTKLRVESWLRSH